jgi:hypothetical protein
MKKIVLLCVLSLAAFGSFAQEFENLDPARQQVHQKDISLLSPLEILEDSLVYMADSMFFSALDDRRIDGSYEFIRIFKSFLKTPGSFQAPLKKLREKIVIMDAPDNKFRIYNWEIIRGPVERRYYGSIQMNDGSSMPLVDISDRVLRGAEDSVFSHTRWYGNLYYNIISRDIGGETAYFLFGWNGNSLNSERKIVDVLRFDAAGKAIFGADVFTVIERNKKFPRKRLIVEYEKGAKVFLNYNTDTKQIIFDHCESQIGDPAKKYTYIPDGTYDGMIWKNDKWEMVENIIPITILKDGEAPVEKAIIR